MRDNKKMVKCYLCNTDIDIDFVGRKVGKDLFICDCCYAKTQGDSSLDNSNADCDINANL